MYIFRIFYPCLPIALAVLSFGFCSPSKMQKQAAGSGNPSDSTALPYNLLAPSATFILSSPELREVSALSPTNQPGVLLAVSDEAGVIYWLNAADGSIRQKVSFRDHGDFEGVEMAGNFLYALKSDGKIFEIDHWTSTPPQVKVYDTFLRKDNDLEGLCFDSLRNALLLACKQDPESDTVRCVYSFDLKQKQLAPKPVYVIDPAEIERLSPARADEKQHYFSPSGLAIHPLRPEIYVISTAYKRLAVLDYTTGKVTGAFYLDKSVLPQPEGIAFDQQGNLFISSEAKKGEARLLRFDYKQLK